MKVSLNWIKQFLDFEVPPVEELVERIGTQLGAVEEVESLGEKYQGVLVAKIISCIDHPDSDHMHVCKVDDGGKAEGVERDENGHVQVVCGAPNVREGLTVAWLPPGSTVPESYDKDPFVLGTRELRGVASNGMLASPRELALSDSHEGIFEIDKDVAPGTAFAEVYKLDDCIIDIENKMFTHRPDCFGALGVAREIAGILHHSFTSPEWYVPNPEFPAKEAELPLRVTNELPELVSRFSAVTLADVQIGPSPQWLQIALTKVGQKSISNIVDLTNFYMLVTGQPLHAYDYDKVRALTGGDTAEITVRFPKPGEKIKLINGKEIEPRAEAMMIASGEHLIGVGGVMGGFDTEVDENTKNIILEAATFDMYNIRRTSMAHGLFTDAVTRFNKGQSPLQNLAVLAKITNDIQKMAHGTVASDVVDISELGERAWVHPPVPVTIQFINERLGSELSADDMKQLLENVECSVGIENDQLTVTAPFWRTDIETREDVVEEVGRLYGFDKLPVTLPLRSIRPATKDPLLELKSHVREVLSTAGANEVLTYSFVHGDLLQKTGQSTEHAFRISNALSPDLQYYRTGLTPSLLDKVHQNVKAGSAPFALFEIGKVHYEGEMDVHEPEVPNEDDHVALVLAYADKQQPAGAPYYHARMYMEQLLAPKAMTLQPLASFDLTHDEWGRQLTGPYEPARSAVVVQDGQIWGVVGEFKANVRRALKLPAFTAGFEIHLDITHSGPSHYEQVSRFPKVSQDVTLKVPAAISYESLLELVSTELTRVQPAESLLNVTPIDIYQREDDQEHKQVTFRLEIASYERTLTDQEVSKLLDAVTVVAVQSFGAERI
jgi:phenylalanyl-tRNA synthetase beta chain